MIRTFFSMNLAAVALLAAGLLAPDTASAAKTTTVQITIKDRKFVPDEVKAPANTPLVLRIKNNDSAPMEFESVTLRVEKVVTGGGQGSIHVRPLKPGRYKFFDDFHPETRGTLVVK